MIRSIGLFIGKASVRFSPVVALLFFFADTSRSTSATPAVILAKTLGCLDESIVKTGDALIKAQDAVAFQKFAIRYFVTKECKFLDKGLIGQVMDTSWNHHDCFRPSGDYECYWTYSFAVKKDGE